MEKENRKKGREQPVRPKPFGRDIEPACEYCARGKRSSDGKSILCTHKGIMGEKDHCRKFLYDPLKREPRRAPALPSFSEEDFSID